LKLAVTVQLASSRRGVPHARNLNRWAHAACAQQLPRGDNEVALTIRVVGAAESRRLNRTWRHKDKPTNVLSFPAMATPLLSSGNPHSGGRNPHPGGRSPHPRGRATSPARGRGQGEGLTGLEGLMTFSELGDLAICAPVVAREAREQGKPAQAHWAHMVVHGVLHLLGYDHVNDRDAKVMEDHEAKILAQFGYSNPYA
jgi:probable rRNA maturation factor